MRRQFLSIGMAGWMIGCGGSTVAPARTLPAPAPAAAEEVAPSSPADARALHVTATRNADTVTVHVSISPDFHIQSNVPSRPELIPTTVTFDAPSCLTLQAPHFPAPTLYHRGDEYASTFKGEIEITIPYYSTSRGPCTESFTGTLSFQACTPWNCLFRADEPFIVPGNVGNEQ